MQMIREIFPNGIPIIIDAELNEDGSVDNESIRIFPIFYDSVHQSGPVVGELFPPLTGAPELALRLIKQLQD